MMEILVVKTMDRANSLDTKSIEAKQRFMEPFQSLKRECLARAIANRCAARTALPIEWWLPHARITVLLNECREKRFVFEGGVIPEQTNVLLYEGWRVEPDDQGEPRFQLSAAGRGRV